MPHGSYDALIAAERNGESPLGWDATSRFIVLYGTAFGMKVLPSKRIIHRDLKPGNVYLNEAFEPCVADFDLWKLVEEGHSRSQTRVRGSLGFMASERLEEEPYDWSADVDSFGMLMYFSTTGQEIFPDLKGARFMTKIVKGARPSFPSGFDSQWKKLIEACWQKKPKKRPTFQAIVDRLCSAEFVNDSIDVDRFRAYQSRILP
jgi:NIMA (never in mitosis gene a)-related kinase